MRGTESFALEVSSRPKEAHALYLVHETTTSVLGLADGTVHLGLETLRGADRGERVAAEPVKVEGSVREERKREKLGRTGLPGGG